MPLLKFARGRLQQTCQELDRLRRRLAAGVQLTAERVKRR